MILLCIVFLLFLGLGHYFHKRDALSPAVIQPCLWGLILLGSYFHQEIYFKLSEETLLLCVASALLFVCGFWFAEKRTAGRHAYTIAISKKAALRYRNVMFVVVIVVLPFYVRTAHSLATTGPLDDMAFNLRYSLSEGKDGPGFGILAYGVPLSLYLLLLESIFYDSKSKPRFALAIVIASIFCVLSTGRTFLLALLIYMLLPLMVSGRLRTGKGMAVLTVIFLPVFYIYAVTLGKDGGSGLQSELEVFSIYLFGGLFAFDQLTQTIVPYGDFGAHLFRIVYAVANAFDRSVHVMPIIEDYQYFGATTNVYTVFGKAFRDFGYFGVAAYMFFIGVFHGYIYCGMKRGSIYYKILFVLSFYPMVMQFFQDQYLGLASTWIQLLMLTLLFKIVTSRGRLKLTYGRPPGGKLGVPASPLSFRQGRY